VLPSNRKADAGGRLPRLSPKPGVAKVSAVQGRRRSQKSRLAASAVNDWRSGGHGHQGSPCQPLPIPRFAKLRLGHARSCGQLRWSAGDTARPRRRRLSYRLDGPRIFLHPGGIPALATPPDVPHSHELSPGLPPARNDLQAAQRAPPHFRRRPKQSQAGYRAWPRSLLDECTVPPLCAAIGLSALIS